MTIPLIGAGLTGDPVATVAFTASAVNAAGGTTFTFTNQAIGSPAPSRKVVVVVQTGGASRTITGVTIAGISASQVVARSASDHVSIWQAIVPSGTTGTVVATASAANDVCGIGVYAVYGAASAATDTGGSTAVTPATDMIDVPANGILIAGVVNRANTETFSWTNLTERYDEALNPNVFYQSGASDAFATAQTGLAITATPTASLRAPVMAMASWGPA